MRNLKYCRIFSVNIRASILSGLLLIFSTQAFSDWLQCPCKVVKVTDGDTVHVFNQQRVKHKIRLAGIDAPEKKQAFGKRSSENLAGYVAGKSIEVEYDNRDRYGHIIGKLLLSGKDINLQQIKDGLAWHYKPYEKEQSVEDRKLYSSSEVRARRSRLGLWS
jgi:endonuclease YncB( thermonuclease family)